MLTGNPNAFCSSPLDKAGNRRREEAWVLRQAESPAARLLLFWRGDILIARGERTSRVQWLGMNALDALPSDRELVLLGLWDGDPVFAAGTSAIEEPPLAELGSYAPLRSAAPYLPPDELSVAGQAAWLLNWHASHRHCARDGDRTVSAEGGFKRVNQRTGAEHYPRTDPVSIVLPEHEGSVCLGRSPHFPPGFMSAFAGYLEPGETLEQCAARELHEEAGLTALSMTYLFSQPWPFPSSLMMGFVADVQDKDLTLDREEIEDARWFSRDELRSVMAGDHPEVRCPPPMAIAHQLMKAWLERT